VTARLGFLFMIALCSCGSSHDAQPRAAARSRTDSLHQIALATPQLRARPASDFRYRWNWRDYPIERFRSFPPDAQQLLQRESKENSLCRGGSGAFRSTYRACNRRDLLNLQLQKIGWCWGRERPLEIEHRLRCSNDYDVRRSGLPTSFGEPYSEESLATLIEDASSR
jgi:hypothetical protein